MTIAVGFVATVGRAALILATTDLLDGREINVRRTLRATTMLIPQLLSWVAVGLVVGLVLARLQRLGPVGKVVRFLADLAWASTTFFVVPVIALEGRSVRDAIRRSASLFKQAWGDVIGAGTVPSVVVVSVILLLAITSYVVAMFVPVLALVLFAGGSGVFLLTASATSGVFHAVLYRYVTTGETALGFEQWDILNGIELRFSR